jgi:hypothetical protein
MTSAAPERIGPVSEQAVVESATPTAAPTGAPRAPMPMPVVGRDPASLPPGEPPLLSVQQLQIAPSSMADLLDCTDWTIRFLCADTSPDGKLMTVLKTAFEADWFKAKSCLVFDKWPGRTPRFDHASSLQLMTALTVLRGEVHKRVMPEAQKAVRGELAKRSAQLKGNKSLADTLDAEKGKAPADQVQYKGSVGADTVTSDVDVSTGGVNSEMAVRAYNESFRKLLKVEFDPGTVFDLNVYAMDFVHGKTDSEDKKSFKVNAENAEDPGAENAADRDDEQEIWSLVHVARYLPDDDEWALLVERTVDGVANPAEKIRQQRLHDKARSRAKGFEARLLGMMEHLEKDVGKAIDALGKSSWSDGDHEHFTEGALRMRAANRLYEDKLLQVKELRAQITTFRKTGADPRKLAKLVADLTGALSMAQLYANEVYGSGGGTVHAVFGMQTKKKLETERGHKVKVEMSASQWMETFTDNLGDVLKDYEHYGLHATGGADYWYAAFKMGKYVDRMLDAVPNLAENGTITMGDRDEIAATKPFTSLTELARYHREEKDGASKNDPQKLSTHPYFKTIDKARLETLKWDAMELGVDVRTRAGNKRAPAPPVQADGPPPATATPSGPPTPGSPVAVLANLQKTAQSTQSGMESVESEAED